MLRRRADKSLAFPIFLFEAQTKQFFLVGLKRQEQQSVWSSGGIYKYIFFNPVACCFLYKVKGLSAPPPPHRLYITVF
jgi:hypothetical protein